MFITRKLFLFIGLTCFVFKPSFAQQAPNFFIQDSAGNLYPQSAYDSLRHVKSIILSPYKNRGIIEGYLITKAPVNTVPFVPKKKKYNIAEIFSLDNALLRIGGKMPKYNLTDLDGNNYNSDSERQSSCYQFLVQSMRTLQTRNSLSQWFGRLL